jgi:hypothetical protein
MEFHVKQLADGRYGVFDTQGGSYGAFADPVEAIREMDWLSSSGTFGRPGRHFSVTYFENTDPEDSQLTGYYYTFGGPFEAQGPFDSESDALTAASAKENDDAPR